MENDRPNLAEIAHTQALGGETQQTPLVLFPPPSPTPSPSSPVRKAIPSIWPAPLPMLGGRVCFRMTPPPALQPHTQKQHNVQLSHQYIRLLLLFAVSNSILPIRALQCAFYHIWRPPALAGNFYGTFTHPPGLLFHQRP